MIQIFLNELELPVNIASFEKDNRGNNEVVNTASLGEIIISKEKSLTTTSFESFFPHTEEVPAITYVEQIEEMRASKTPINLVITEINEDLLVLIDNFRYNRSSSNYEDINYSITFTEYKPFGVIVEPTAEDETPAYDETKPTPPPRSDENKPPVGRTYTVVSGDNLYNITKLKTGSGNRWRELYNINTETIGGNPNLIFPGQILNIPEGWV